jgi:hypothetical protein
MFKIPLYKGDYATTFFHNYAHRQKYFYPSKIKVKYAKNNNR